MELEKFEIRPELKIIAHLLKKLKDDRIIRTKNLVGDLGEYYCRVVLNLKLENNVVNKGFDAKDKDGNRVEIKTRWSPTNKSKVIFKGFNFNYCLFVELDDFFLPKSILKIDVKEIIKNLDADGERMSVGKIRNTNHTKII